jgi:hypothetical protein
MLTKREALRTAVVGSFTALAEPAAWKDIGMGLIGLLAQAIRLCILLTLPISAPIIAWLLVLDDRKRAAQLDEIHARLRRGIHQNGPSK